MANKSRLYGKEVIQEIIHRYLEENDIKGEIEYSNVRDYAFNLREENDPIFTRKMYYQLVNQATGEISEKIYKNIKLSDDFWRKKQYQGRQLIDEVNELMSKTVAATKKRQVFIPNIDFILETHKNNFSQLKLQLKPLEEQLKTSIKNEEILENKIEKLQQEIQKLKLKNNEVLNQNSKLQDSLYKMFEYSVSKDTPLENQLNTGKGKTKRVEQALKEAFCDDPTAFYLKFKNSTPLIENDELVSNIESYRAKKNDTRKLPTYDDEYDFE
ncbi:hypothetical protein [Priestia sp. YIM B13489]|uniref:hypothetical protein n=1 Tax=Priestia sp. YIM B13489 TaxID=3366313 RepID=UPI00366F47D1